MPDDHLIKHRDQWSWLFDYGWMNFERPAFFGTARYPCSGYQKSLLRIIFLPNLILVKWLMLLNKAFIISYKLYMVLVQDEECLSLCLRPPLFLLFGRNCFTPTTSSIWLLCCPSLAASSSLLLCLRLIPKAWQILLTWDNVLVGQLSSKYRAISSAETRKGGFVVGLVGGEFEADRVAWHTR